MSQANVESVRRSLDAWNRDDFETYVSGAHPEVEWTSEVAERMAGSGTVYTGVEGLRRHWDEWREVWTVKINVIDVIDLGDTVIAVAETIARGHGMGVEMQQPVAYVFEFEDGLTRRARSSFDVDQVLRSFGVDATGV
jgi:ketosteroid isomerase-like protein